MQKQPITIGFDWSVPPAGLIEFNSSVTADELRLSSLVPAYHWTGSCEGHDHEGPAHWYIDGWAIVPAGHEASTKVRLEKEKES